MKRVVAVCVIIALILAASTAALMHLLRVSDEMEASLSAIADAIDRDDMPRAARLTDEFHEQWERNETVMTRYIHHDELDTITGIVARLPMLAKYGETAEYAAEVARLRHLISHIRDAEIPRCRISFSTGTKGPSGYRMGPLFVSNHFPSPSRELSRVWSSFINESMSLNCR
ncbi:MAG: DUF4363 family protein [Anaerotruncus massiliensis (ex Togo et al. 2019)]